MQLNDCNQLRRRARWFMGPLWALAAACEADDSLPATADAALPVTLDAGQAANDAGPPAAPGPDLIPSMDAGGTDAGVSTSARDAAMNEPDSSLDAGGADSAVADAMPIGSTWDASNGADAATMTRDATSDATTGQGQEAGAARVISVDSKAEWAPSGFHVDAGKCYSVSAKIDDRWLDDDVPADLNGWVDQNDVRLVLFEPFRRVATDDIRFYQFAACVDRDLTQCFPVGATTTVCPKVSGELFFFINDAPGFEGNNVGTATVTLAAK